MLEDRETIESKLAYARAERGKALADGKVYNNSIITALENQLNALDDVAQELERRKRETAATLERKNLSEKRAKLEALLADDLMDAQAGQEAAMILAASFSRRLDRITTLSRL